MGITEGKMQSQGLCWVRDLWTLSWDEFYTGSDRKTQLPSAEAHEA